MTHHATPAQNPQRPLRIARRRRPELENLEGRLLLTRQAWLGASPTSSNWSDPRNWLGLQVPANGDDLEFPAGASRLTSTNDLSATNFRSITFTSGGSGFVLNGNAFEIGAGGIADTGTAGTNTINMNLRLPGGFPGSSTGIVNNATLRLGGSISTARVVGNSDLIKDGNGELVLQGAAANSFRGTTTALSGKITLAKSGVVAVPRALIIGDGSSPSSTDAIVALASDNQIADNSAVTINLNSRLDLAGNDDAIGALTMTGARIDTGAGVLTLNGNVLVKGSNTQSQVTGIVSLGQSTKTFTVEPGLQGGNLVLGSELRSGALGAGMTKLGEGVMRLGGSTSNSLLLGIVTVNEGTLVLQKSVGVDAVVAPIVVGDGVGVDQLINGFPFQLGASASVTVNSSGIYDISNGEEVPGLTLNGGRVRANGQNNLRLFGNVTATSDAAGNPAVIEGVDRLNFQGQDHTFTVNDGPGAVDLLVSNAIVTTAGDTQSILTKDGAGTMVVTGNNTISDMITIGGTLLVDGVQPDVFLRTSNGGAIVGGRGRTGRLGVFDVGGIVSPGSPEAGPGALTVTGFSFERTDGIYRVQLNGLQPGLQYDQVRAAGQVSLNLANLELSLNFQPTTGDTFTIIENQAPSPGATSGQFRGLPEGSTFSVGGWEFSITYDGGPDANDVVLTYNGVRAPNEAPVLSRIGPKAARVGDALSFKAKSADANGDLLSYSLAPGAPAGARIDPVSGLFTWTPPKGASGVYKFAVIVTDNGPAHAVDFETVRVVVRRARGGRASGGLSRPFFNVRR